MKILISLMARFYGNTYKNLGIEGNFHENLKVDEKFNGYFNFIEIFI